jgi:hypothetical protein
MKYPNLAWYIADDGSSRDDFLTIDKEICENEPVGSIIGGHNDPKMTPGISWNNGLKTIFQHTDFYFRLEDDWSPSQEIDLRPWVKMLIERDDIAMVRLGYQHVPANMQAIGHDGIHYYRYSKTTPFAYGGHPAIIHRRLHDAYGYFHTSRNPGEIEVHFDEQVRKKAGPDIVRPASIGGNGAWNHFGEKKAY